MPLFLSIYWLRFIWYFIYCCCHMLTPRHFDYFMLIWCHLHAWLFRYLHYFIDIYHLILLILLSLMIFILMLVVFIAISLYWLHFCFMIFVYFIDISLLIDILMLLGHDIFDYWYIIDIILLLPLFLLLLLLLLPFSIFISFDIDINIFHYIFLTPFDIALFHWDMFAWYLFYFHLFILIWFHRLPLTPLRFDYIALPLRFRLPMITFSLIDWLIYIYFFRHCFHWLFHFRLSFTLRGSGWLMIAWFHMIEMIDHH